MSRHQRRSTTGVAPKRGCGCGCLPLTIATGVVLLAFVTFYAFLMRPMISGFIGMRVSERLIADLEVGETVLPDAIAALPKGETVVDQKQANAFIADHNYGPLEEANISFANDQVVANITAFGTQGVARSGISTENGQVTLVDPTLDGALGLILSVDDLLDPLVEELNAELARQDRYVESIEIERGQLVVVTK